MTPKVPFFKYLYLFFVLCISISVLFIGKNYTLFILLLFSFGIIYFLYDKALKESLFYEKIYRTISYLPKYHELKPLLDFVIHATSELLNADRTSLFLLNKETDKQVFFSKTLLTEREI